MKLNDLISVIKAFLIFSGFIFILSSCNDDEDPEPDKNSNNDSNPEGIHAKIDDDNWKSNSSTAIFKDKSDSIKLNAQGPSNSSLKINIDGDTTGTYLAEDFSEQFSLTFIDSSGTKHTLHDNNNTLTISKIDKQNGIISGNFDVTISFQNAGPISTKNMEGTFKIKNVNGL